jgi:modulator of FtsH protease HflC
MTDTLAPAPSSAQGSSSLMSRVLHLTFAAVVAGLIVCYSMYFSVPEGTAAVVTRFGEPMREITQAGPYWKWPWPVEQVHSIDRRHKLSNTPYTATFTRDKRNLVFLTYFVWRVEKPLLFLQSTGGSQVAEKKLDGMVTAAKNFYVGRYDLSALVSTSAADIRTEEIERAILEDVQRPALDKFGIVVEQVGFKRVAFAEENVPAVLANMRSERKAEADRLRAEGEKEAQAIRDDALVRSEEILREGREKAGMIRGKAEKEAAEVYAAVHKLDPDFYRFWRSLEALKKVLGGKSTLILRTDQGFFDVLGDPSRPIKPMTGNGARSNPPEAPPREGPK